MISFDILNYFFNDIDFVYFLQYSCQKTTKYSNSINRWKVSSGAFCLFLAFRLVGYRDDYPEQNV